MSVVFRIYLVLVALIGILGGFIQYAPISSAQILFAVMLYITVWFGLFKIFNLSFTSPINLFLLGLFIVQLQFPLDYTLGRLDDTIMRYWIDLRVVNAGVWITVFFVSTFAFFFSLPFKIRIRNKVLYKTQPDKFGIFLLVLVILYALIIDKAYLLGGYGRVEINNSARLIGISIDIFLLSTLGYTLYVGKYNMSFKGYIKALGSLFWVAFVLYTILIIISGDRGPVVYPLIALGFVYVSLNGTLSIRRMLFLGILGALFINTLSLFRNNDIDRLVDIYEVMRNKSNKESGLLSGSIGNSFSPYTAELATSVRSLNCVLAEREQLDWGYGHFQFSQIITVIPFAKGVYSRIIGIDDVRVSSERYVSHLQGYNDSSQGSSLLADAYLDFGYFSVGLVALIMGIVYRFINRYQMCKGNSVFANQLYLIVGAYSVYFPRSSFLFCFKLVVISSIVVLLMVLWSNLRY